MIDERNGKTVSRTSGKLFGVSTIFGHTPEGARDPYMTRIWLGRLRLHIFHRPDEGEDHHDHPWDFWTFPLTPYVESVVDVEPPCEICDTGDAACICALTGTPKRIVTYLKVVRAWWPHFRKAVHCHRVLGRYVSLGPGIRGYRTTGKIVTLVWRSKMKRQWGFLKHRNGQWCWLAWRDYILNGGHEGPCT